MATSVVILIIDEFNVTFVEREGQPPVATDTHAPMAHRLFLLEMQSPAGDVHVRRIAGDIERRELSRQPGRVRGRNPSLAAGPEEPLDTLVPKGLYHLVVVAYGATRHKVVIDGSKELRLVRQSSPPDASDSAPCLSMFTTRPTGSSSRFPEGELRNEGVHPLAYTRSRASG